MSKLIKVTGKCSDNFPNHGLIYPYYNKIKSACLLFVCCPSMLKEDFCHPILNKTKAKKVFGEECISMTKGNIFAGGLGQTIVF